MPDSPLSPSLRLHRLLIELEHLMGDLAADGTDAGAGSPRQTLEGPDDASNDADLAACAAELYRLRRRRENHLSRDLLGEPCWDMLLDLFIQGARSIPVSVMAACAASNVPTSTALRWMASLEADGLLERYRDARDRRVVLLRLTPDGMRKMRTTLVDARERGFYPR